MLIRFALENYNSFKDRQMFSMVAGKQTRHASHYFTVNGKRLLKSSFFFGANASGKSNFVHALDFMRRVTLAGTNSVRHSDRYFRIDPAYKEKPGVFQVDYVAGETVYSYGFAIQYLTREIWGEWLYRLDPAGKEICVFERELDKPTRTELPLDKTAKMRFQIYCEDIRNTQLLLTEVGNKNLDEESGLLDFLDAYNWFKRLTIVYPNSHAHNKHDFFLNPASDIESLTQLLQTFDTGIEDITKGKQPIDKALSFLPKEVRKDVVNRIDQELREAPEDMEQCMVEISGYQFELSMDDGEIYAEKIMLNHGNLSDLFELSDESDGTKRLFDLIPLYELGQKDRVIVVDEVDRSLHSKLTQEFVKLFFRYTKDKPSQLICTTHDLNLMDLNLLRQDEIWFVERENDHSTRLYSLSDYKQRFDTNVLNNYLIGRYGAIPNLQDSEWQVDDE